MVQAFDFLVSEHLDAGRLVQILEGYSTDAMPVHALCRPGRQRAPKVRVFLDYLSETLGR